MAGGPPFDTARIFAGGRRFRARALGLRSPPLPEIIYSRNLTQHATGLANWTADDVVRVLKDGKDREGQNVCRPMPSGPKGSFAGLTVEDARDIANYIVTLPGIDNALPSCADDSR